MRWDHAHSVLMASLVALIWLLVTRKQAHCLKEIMIPQLVDPPWMDGVSEALRQQRWSKKHLLISQGISLRYDNNQPAVRGWRRAGDMSPAHDRDNRFRNSPFHFLVSAPLHSKGQGHIVPWPPHASGS